MVECGTELAAFRANTAIAGDLEPMLLMTTTNCLSIGRRSLLLGAAAVGVARSARAAPRLAPPTLISAGKLVMSTNPTVPPLMYVDRSGELKGLRIEMGVEIARRLELTAEYVRTDFAPMIPGLAARRWDMINTGVAYTEDRAKAMFLIPYEVAAISYTVQKGNPAHVATPDDLAGKRIGVELGTNAEIRTRELSAQLVAKGLEAPRIQIFATIAEALLALRARQIDVVASIDATAKLMADRGDTDRALSRLFPQLSCLAVRDKVIADAVVLALNEMRADGWYDRTFDQYGVGKVEEQTFSIRGPGPTA